MAQDINIDVDLIVKEYGKYYENAGQNKSRIKRALMQEPETVHKYATRIKTSDTVYKMANEEWDDVLQPFRLDFEPSGGIKFIPNKIELFCLNDRKLIK